MHNSLLMFFGDMIRRNLNEQLKWCIRKSRGIVLVRPNRNICDSYQKKADETIKSVKILKEAKQYPDAISLAYYGRYNIVYAFLMKCGIKSEIHDCTIALIRFLFSDRISSNLLDELELARKQRIDEQYYTNKHLNEKQIHKNLDSLPTFVLTIQEIIYSLKDEDIEKLRKRIISI